MEARITIQPLATFDTYASEIDITDRIISNVSVSARAEVDDWSYGIISHGQVNLILADPDRRFDDLSPNSIFAAAGKDRATVRVYMAGARGGRRDNLVWRGVITSKHSQTKPATGETKLQCRTVDTVIREAFISAGTIVNGQTLPVAIAAALNTTLIADALQSSELLDFNKDLINIAIDDASELVESDGEAEATLKNIFRALDAMLTYDFKAEKAIIFPRGGIDDDTNYPELNLNSERLIDIVSIKDGTEQLYNEVVLSYQDGDDTAKLIIDNEASINAYGLRALAINCKWLFDENEVRFIGEYLLNRLRQPRRRITILIDALALGAASVIVGRKINLNLTPPLPSNASAYGAGSYGGARYGRERYRSIQGSFFIEEVKRMLRDDTMELVLRERL